MATPLLNGIRPPGNSFVLPEHKIVYMSVTKAACTSLRWTIAHLSGENPEAFYRTPVGHQSRLMTIHNRRRWKRTPQLKDLSEDQLAQISRDNGWFIFAVVRDPWSRLWSAWQSKFLVQYTPYIETYSDEPWLPRVPETAEDVVEDFHRFVSQRPWETHPVLSTDVHFLPQVKSVRPQGVNYTRIYDVREMGTLLQDLTTHVEALGLPADLYTPRANENPLGLTTDVLDDKVREVVAESYSADFETFGDQWSLDQVKLVDNGWSSDAIRLVQYHATANERIGDVAAEAKRLRSELRTTQRQLQEARNGQPVPSGAAAEGQERPLLQSAKRIAYPMLRRARKLVRGRRAA